jgi:hypothetical protein
MAQTGNQGTIAFGTSGFTGAFTQIGAWKPKLGKLEDSDLSTEGFKTFVPDDLADPGSIAIKVWFDPTKALPPIGSPETVTITFPPSEAGADQATLVGTGFFSDPGTPEMVNGKLMEQDFTLEWDGKTGPAFTPETAGSSS